MALSILCSTSPFLAFIVFDLDRTFALDLQKEHSSQLKKWAYIGRSVDTGLLFRSKENFGLGLTSICDHYERMQLVKCELLRNSTDSDIRELYRSRSARNAKLTRVWKATKLLSEVDAEVDLNLKFPVQNNNLGIGFGNFNPNPSILQRRKLVTSKALSFSEQKRVAHSATLKQQGAWLQWAESAIPFDFSWKNLIWGGISPDLIKFILASSVNWARTPNLMKLWGWKKTAACCLCAADTCTLHHILSNCSYALADKRYTWRHDSVLFEIHRVLSNSLQQLNQVRVQNNLPHISLSFVPAGHAVHHKQKKLQKGLLHKANDWKIIVNLEEFNYIFPPEIIPTSLRPDVVVWSNQLKRAIIIELTCAAEEGIEAAHIQKESKCLPLIAEITTNSIWKANLFTIEIGVRRFIDVSLNKTLRALGIPQKAISQLGKNLATIAACCSYAIYLAAKSFVWDNYKNHALKK